MDTILLSFSYGNVDLHISLSKAFCAPITLFRIKLQLLLIIMMLELSNKCSHRHMLINRIKSFDHFHYRPMVACLIN